VLSKVHLPSSAAEAAGLLRGGGWLVGGGTVVMPKVNTGAVPVEHLISLRHAGLAGIRVNANTVTIGAATTLAAVGADDRLGFLRPVIRSIASPPQPPRAAAPRRPRGGAARPRRPGRRCER
jgi:CO/xanthine dehydrogenase FAD-binding subunit